MSNRKVLLIEPNYKNKYPPMGLMKLAMYYRLQGDDVTFWKGDFTSFVVEELLKDENKFNSYLDSLENNNDIPYEEGLEIAERYKMNYFETSKENSQNLYEYYIPMCLYYTI